MPGDAAAHRSTCDQRARFNEVQLGPAGVGDELVPGVEAGRDLAGDVEQALRHRRDDVAHFLPAELAVVAEPVGVRVVEAEGDVREQASLDAAQQRAFSCRYRSASTVWPR